MKIFKSEVTRRWFNFFLVQFICFVLQNEEYTNICDKNFFRKHRKAVKWPYGLLVNCLSLNSGTKKKKFFLIRKITTIHLQNTIHLEKQ